MLIVFIGLLMVIFGIVIKNKKWLWLHQGLIKRPVDVDKYTNYMGRIDVVTGIIFIIVGIMIYYLKISQTVLFIICIIYCACILYGEIKYREKK